MLHNEALGVLLGAIALGAVHGIEPGHGWPIAASYALDRTNKWASGLAASLIIGVGHLISSIAMVAVFFYAKAYFNLTQVNDPLTVFEGVTIGGPVDIVAGVLLIGLGIREYTHSHSHGHDPSGDRDHSHGGSHSHGEDHSHETGHSHDESHPHEDPLEGVDRGLLGLAWFAFVLGFAHEEEFEIIALCAGSDYCLELMGVYAITVIVGIVGLTLLLIAGYEHHEETVDRYTPYLPLISSTVLIAIGVGFIVGVL
jgi:ABC-type nickel/cobalt efflux system permease component RcnA